MAKAERPAGRVVRASLFTHRSSHGAQRFSDAPPRRRPKTKPLRVAYTLALAHELQGMLDRGEVCDRAELSRCLAFSRARVTQLLNLLRLAPDIQADLVRTRVPLGRDPIGERQLRPLVQRVSWAEQRALWTELQGRLGSEPGAGLTP